ncbi:MAG: sugar ABC transporter permease, partial [Alphaproteobacteria bacterium]|nr:sugar ABC transporter permease [Alphaproteobacteria bacterium]
MSAGRWTAERSRGVGYGRPSFAFLLNAPSLVVIVLLVGYPIAQSAWISLHRYNLKRPNVFR